MFPSHSKDNAETAEQAVNVFINNRKRKKKAARRRKARLHGTRYLLRTSQQIDGKLMPSSAVGSKRRMQAKAIDNAVT